ncbi:MAG: hypothetical protein GY854_17275 [Deltaproteobacteria bacterium]|nr:hypothetical protein [Deltaproteobacteria bacterium]
MTLTPIEMLRKTAEQLGPLTKEVVFVGGTTTAIFITDTAAASPRITDDVDCILQATKLIEFYRFAERLQKRGFSPDPEGPICRYRSKEIIIDVMPTDESILGFSNRWYSEAVRYAQSVDIGKGIQIRTVTAPYFVATKLDAFWGRGNNDFFASRDLEDVIAVIDGREELLDEIENKSTPQLRSYLSEQITTLFENQAFVLAVYSIHQNHCDAALVAGQLR